MHLIEREHSPRRHIYVVLGMARSGTSAITRGLKALGIELGSQLLPANKKWGPTGLWEEEFVHKINRNLTDALEQPLVYLREPELIKEKRQHLLKSFEETAVKLLKRRVESSSHWAFKNPRTAINLSFWQNVLKQVQVEEHYIIALRNPLSSATSNHHVSGCDVEIALLSWLMHNISAIEGTHNKNRIVIDYNLLMQNPELQLNRIKQELNIPDLADPSEIDDYVHHYLDKKLKHFENSQQDLRTSRAMKVVPLCLRVYELLFRVASDEISFTSDAFKIEWQGIIQEFESIYPLYRYLDTLLQKNKVLERTVRFTNKSLFWRLLFPLRMIEDNIRLFIRNFKEQKKLNRIYER